MRASISLYFEHFPVDHIESKVYSSGSALFSLRLRFFRRPSVMRQQRCPACTHTHNMEFPETVTKTLKQSMAQRQAESSISQETDSKIVQRRAIKTETIWEVTGNCRTSRCICNPIPNPGQVYFHFLYTFFSTFLITP